MLPHNNTSLVLLTRKRVPSCDMGGEPCAMRLTGRLLTDCVPYIFLGTCWWHGSACRISFWALAGGMVLVSELRTRVEPYYCNARLSPYFRSKRVSVPPCDQGGEVIHPQPCNEILTH